MRTAVLDASAIVAVLLDPKGSPGVVELIEDEDADLLVPHSCDLEVTSVLRRLERSGVLGLDRARAALSVYVDLPLSRLPHTVLLGRAFGLRDHFTVYDAACIALTEAMGATLYTANHRLACAVWAHTSVDIVEV
jgi:predicted nucleic acid-binding protein